MTSSYNGIVSHGMLGTHPLVTTFRYVQDSTTTDLEIPISCEHIAKFLNQTVSVTQKAPGMWDARLTLDGAGSTSWAYKQIAALTAAVSDTGYTIEMVNADAAKFTAGSYYINNMTGEIIYVNWKGTAGTTNTEVHLDRGLFGTAATAFAQADTFSQLDTIVVKVAKLGSAGTKKGFGILTYVPMPMPGFGQKYFSNSE